MSARIHDFDWAATPLGPMAAWPQPLRTAIDIVLGSGHAMQLAWGPERTILYNDAYAPMLGERHPQALGLPFSKAWPEIWDEIAPLVTRVFAGETVCFEDMPLIMERHGYREETWWTFSYSPIRDEGGAVAGLLNVTVDTSASKRAELAERTLRENEERQSFLLGLADALRPLNAPEEVMSAATRLLNTQLGSSRCAYYEIEDGDYVILRDSARGVPSLVGRYPVESFGSTLFDKHVDGQSPLVVGDVALAHSLEEAGHLAAIQVRAYISVMLLKQGRFVCGLTVHASAPRAWSAHEVVLAQDTAERTWAAVEQARAEAALRAMQEQQRLTLELVPALLWSSDPAGTGMAVSEGWWAYTGQRPEEAGDADWLAALPPEDRPILREAFAHALASGEPIERQQRIHSARHGAYRWHLLRHVPVRDARGTIERWFGAAVDTHEIHRLQERQQVLVAELQHRTFNLMGMVRATAEATIKSSASLEDFRGKFRDRIAALARAQRLLSRLKDDGRITFDELIHAEFDAAGVFQPERNSVVLEGPQGVALRSQMVQTLAMALHELTTNAIKYGALGQAGAQLTVRWHVEQDDAEQPWLHVAWQESGVTMPPAPCPTRKTELGTGQGRVLIEQALPYQFGAQTSYVLGDDGVRCSIALPVSNKTRAESLR
ncbi:PAS domain-containing sensor histidine kinase [Novosphingobium rosa]|uniref:PAS domain-containing sensor histidine kinase n=1 Tax=Novosphingobium rosa TaxID=76978 RepID=UPI001472071B|nr:PAS domain-containing protein [Novosphingobium rosa]